MNRLQHSLYQLENSGLIAKLYFSALMCFHILSLAQYLHGQDVWGCNVAVKFWLRATCHVSSFCFPISQQLISLGNPFTCACQSSHASACVNHAWHAICLISSSNRLLSVRIEPGKRYCSECHADTGVPLTGMCYLCLKIPYLAW